MMEGTLSPLEQRIAQLFLSRSELPVIFMLVFIGLGLGFFTSLMGTVLFWGIFESLLKVHLDQLNKKKGTGGFIEDIQELKLEMNALKLRISALEQQHSSEDTTATKTKLSLDSATFNAVMMMSSAKEDDFSY